MKFDHLVRVGFTAESFRDLKTTAQQLGLSQSAFVRTCVLREIACINNSPQLPLRATPKRAPKRGEGRKRA